MSAELGGGGDGDALLESEPPTLDTTPTTTAAENQAPVAVNDYYELNEDETLTTPALPSSMALMANDYDPDGDTFRMIDGTAPELHLGTWTWDLDQGTLTVDPRSDFNGLLYFSYFLVDSAGNAGNLATVKVKVNAVNDAPTVTPITVAPATAGAPVNFTANASDVAVDPAAWESDDPGEVPGLVAAARAIEGTSLTFSLDGEPEGATIDPVTGAFSWPSAVAGTWTFDVVATDNGTMPLSGRQTVTIVVASDGPTVAIAGAPQGSVVEGSAVALTSVVTGSDPADTFTYAWDVARDGVPFASGTAADFGFTPGDDGTYEVTLTVTDDDGDAASAGATIVVTNAAPAVTITGVPASEVAEGSFITLGSTVTDAGSSDAHTYLWTVARDGQAYAVSGLSSLVLTPDDNGLYVVTLVATDDDGAASEVATATITVGNVAPTVTIDDNPGSGSGGPAVRVAGEPIALEGSAHDPGMADELTYTWHVTKDGSPFLSDTGLALAFTPVEGGTYLVSLTVADDDGGVGDDATSLIVVDAPILLAAAATPSAVEEGGTVVVSGTVSGGRVSGGYDVLIDWGDGTASPGQVIDGAFAASHVYADDNAADAYGITVTVSDTAGASGTAALSVTVTNAAPVVTIHGAPASADEGTAVTLTGTVADAGLADTQDLAWSVTRNGSPFASGTGGSISFTAVDDGTYVVTLAATDDDGGTGSATSTIVVNNVAPVVTLVSPAAGTNYLTGSTVDIAASFTDAGLADTHTVSLSVITPGGTAASVAATVDASGNVSASYTVTERGVYEIVLTVTDDDLGTTTVRRYVAVDAAQQESTEGFVAGGGWYYSDAGSNALSPTQEGKAHFAAVAWYEEGYESPMGMMLFRVGTMTFRSSRFESLHVEGNKATLEGAGTLDGVAGYSFRVTLVDGSSTGTADEIRVEIRRADTGVIVYDSNPGEDEDELTALLGGNLKVTG